MAITVTADGGTASTTAPTGSGLITLLARPSTGVNLLASPGGANTTITGTGDTSTGSVDCPGCCGPYYLPDLFGAPTGGLCNGAISNTTPVTLTATVVITPASGISLATYCLPTSASFTVTTSNPLQPRALYLASAPAACTTVTPPTTRFLTAPLSAGSYIFFAPGPLTMVGSFAVCDCTTSRVVNFIGNISLVLVRDAYDCSVPSVTYGQGTIYSGGTYIGTWNVTFTP